MQGRGFVFASQFAKLLPVQLAGQYLEAAIQVIEATEASIPIKISAVKAVHKCVTDFLVLYTLFIIVCCAVSAKGVMIQL